MVNNSRAAAKATANKGATISSILVSGKNKISMVNDANLNNLNNEQILQYIKRL